MKIKRAFKNKKVLLSAVIIILVSMTLVSYNILTNRKYVDVILDGKKRVVSTRQVFFSGFVNSYTSRRSIDEFIVTSKQDGFDFVDNETSIMMSTKKDIELQFKDETRVITTYRDTVSELMEELAIESENKNDSFFATNKKADDLLVDHNHIKVVHETKKVVEKTENSKMEVKYKYNDNMYETSQKVIQKGKEKKVSRTYEITYHDGREADKKVLNEKILAEGIPKIIEKGTKKIKITLKNVWEKLAKCESGGRWSLNTGNGYYGGLQFSKGTWTKNAKKVGVTATRADLASKEEQILVASYVQKKSGWGQWPHCSKKLGLR